MQWQAGAKIIAEVIFAIDEEGIDALVAFQFGEFVMEAGDEAKSGGAATIFGWCARAASGKATAASPTPSQCHQIFG